MEEVEPDFGGYATKADLECTDGRTIKPDAFKHMHGVTVPLVWQHGHNNITNVLGHAVLEARPDGVYAHGFFNDTPHGDHAKKMVKHKDVNRLSIYANQLREISKKVLHGVIREVSLVIAGANPEAKIDYVRIAHSEYNIETLEDEAVIHTGLELDVYDDEDEDGEVQHADAMSEFAGVYESMTPAQKEFLHFVVGAVDEANSSAEHSDSDENNTAPKSEDDADSLSHKEGQEPMKHNVFENNEGSTTTATKERHFVSHDDLVSITAAAKQSGSLKHALNEYALQHGVTNIEALFPDPKALDDRPQFLKRRTEWVSRVINGVGRTRFSRIKTIWGDLTQDDARAKGYIKGEYKKEEWFGLSKRTTGPTTVYKKQTLDRDDIIDIVDMDVVAWLKWEIRFMLEEEIARAILIGDGRDVEDDDKIKDPMASVSGDGIRSIANEHEIFAATVYINLGDSNSSLAEAVDEIIRSSKYYKGTGTPDLYTTRAVITDFLLMRDGDGRRMYRTLSDLAQELRVGEIIEVEPMEDEEDLFGIIVNLQDYNVGTDRGGEVMMFDEFDLDYNKQKYLMETRCSGALTRVRSAVIIRKTTGTNVLVSPNSPTFVAGTGVITIPSQTGVVYKNKGTGATLSSGAQSAITAGTTFTVLAVPASGYYFADNQNDEFSFTRPAA